MNRWVKTGDNGRYQKFTAALGTPASIAASLLQQSSATLTDASYIRLKNISLSYELKRFKALSFLQASKIFVEAQNLVTLTNYRGADPENQNSQALPPLRMIAFGLQFKF